MKKIINGTEIEMTAEEVAAHNQSQENVRANIQSLIDANEAKENLKASAKAKLVAGEALTEEEANVMIGG